MQSTWCSPDYNARPLPVQNVFNFSVSTASPPARFFAGRRTSRCRTPSPSSSCERSPLLLSELSPAFGSACKGSSFTMKGNFGGWANSEPVAKRLCLGSLSAVATPTLLPAPNNLLSPICLPGMAPSCPSVPNLVSLPSPQINTAFGLLSPRSLQTSAPLVGDFSRPHLLPVMDNQAEVKKITPSTLRKALLGEYNQLPSGEIQPEIVIVDCRYPYEYEGGHIKGAINLYGDESITSELLRRRPELHSKSRSSEKPVLVVFHCEFSVKRSVDRLRHLRKHDRLENVENYPGLFFPEVYLLSGGYCDFYAQSPDMCLPQAYTTMKDDGHSQDFIRFSRGKTYDGSSRQAKKFRRFGSTLV